MLRTRGVTLPFSLGTMQGPGLCPGADSGVG